MNITELCNRLSQLPGCEVTYFKGNRVHRKTYPEAALDVKVFSEWMVRSGVTRGMRVGILAENCYEWLLCEIASLQLGCVFVTFPPDEFVNVSLDSMAEKYALRLMLLSGKEQIRRQTPRAWTGCIDDDTLREMSVRAPLATEQNGGMTFSLDPDVYSLVFSSGTSGKLKCILMYKRGTEELLDAYGKNYNFEPTDQILVVLPLSNFQQRLMMYTAIWYGFNMQIADPPRFFLALKEMRPTILAGPPAFFEVVENRFRNLPPRQRFLLQIAAWLVGRVPFRAPRERLLKKLFAPFHKAYGGRVRIMLTGSAPIRESTLVLFEQMGFPIYQVYGLTEVGFVAWNLPGRNRRGSVGKLVFQGGAYLAEDGEIMVHRKFPQSPGYLDDQEEQALTFLGAKGVATGDIGRFDEDGYLYIIGRKKQIIITQGGYKLQPEPIETEIERCPDVDRVVLFGGGDLPLLVALVCLRGKDDPEVRQRVKRHIDLLNLALPSPSRVGRVVYTANGFTRENGLLTRNLKINRPAVYQAFHSVLMGMETAAAIPGDKLA